MNIVVLNGSPKGDRSVTLQYVRFAARKNPDIEFNIINISQNIAGIERDKKRFDEILSAVKKADAVIWSFPLYFLLVPSQYKRFIELIFERKQEKAFAGKYAASISTSIHFFDHTAHNYINAISDDLGMKYAGAYSPAMYDLLRGGERKRLLEFIKRFIESAMGKRAVQRSFPPVVFKKFQYKAGKGKAALDLAGKKMLILKDGGSGNTDEMVKAYSGNFTGETEIVDLSDIDIKGGCLGCCKCGLENSCSWEGKDGFVPFYRERVLKADILVFAGAIRDRYLSAKWKEYFDRTFCNTHIPVLKGKQIVFLISGPLGQIPNLRQVLEGYVEMQEANISAIVTDEPAESRSIDVLIRNAAESAVSMSMSGYRKPVTYLGVGGGKIFRDDVYGSLRFVFQEDHRYNLKHGKYDFPQKEYKTRMMNLVMMTLTKLPFFRKKFLAILKDEMVKPVKYVAENK